MKQVALRNHTKIVLYVKIEFFKRKDGKAHVLIHVFDCPQQDDEQEYESLDPCECLTASCQLPDISTYKIRWPRYLINLKTKVDENAEEDVFNITLSDTPQNN